MCSTDSFFVFLTQFGYRLPNIVFMPFCSYPFQQASLITSTDSLVTLLIVAPFFTFLASRLKSTPLRPPRLVSYSTGWVVPRCFITFAAAMSSRTTLPDLVPLLGTNLPSTSLLVGWPASFFAMLLLNFFAFDLSRVTVFTLSPSVVIT